MIKIERSQGDFACGYDNAVHGDSTYFVWLNRGKESIVLDYTQPEDAALLQRLIAHAAILEALLQRERTGEGSAIHVSLFDAMCDWMTVPLLHFDYAGTRWPRVGLSHPTIAPYGAFPVGGAVGPEHTILIGVQNDGEWQRFAARVLERPDLLESPAYQSNRLRVEHREALDREIRSVLANLTIDEVRKRLQAGQIAFASVNDVAALSGHPHLRRTEVTTPHGVAGIVAPPAFVRGEARPLGPVPGLGEHTQAIRDEFA